MNLRSWVAGFKDSRFFWLNSGFKITIHEWLTDLWWFLSSKSKRFNPSCYSSDRTVYWYCGTITLAYAEAKAQNWFPNGLLRFWPPFVYFWDLIPAIPPPYRRLPNRFFILSPFFWWLAICDFFPITKAVESPGRIFDFIFDEFFWLARHFADLQAGISSFKLSLLCTLL